jgi:hypothetical protein
MAKHICVNCGQDIGAGVFGFVVGRRCPHCGLPWQSPVIEAELAKASEGWTSPVVVRTYPSDKAGRVERGAETRLLRLHGYALSGQAEESPGLVHSGRIFLARVLSALAIGPLPDAPKDSVNVTYTKQAPGQER